MRIAVVMIGQVATMIPVISVSEPGRRLFWSAEPIQPA
jgi:hypothetical protein